MSKRKPKSKKQKSLTSLITSFVQKRKSLVFALMVGLIGVLTLLYSFAATQTVITSIEAENMSWNRGIKKTTSPKIIEQALYWSATGTATTQLTVPGEELSIYARGDQCDGSPILTVDIDGKQILKKSITNEALEIHRVKLDPKIVVTGKHSVKLSFINDHARANACDRNLYIDKVVFRGTKQTPIINPKPAEIKPAPPAPSKTYNPNASYNIIMIGWRPYDKEYTQLANANTNLVFRSIHRTESGNKAKLDLWDSMGSRYFNNVAGSDWASSGKGGACKNIPLSYMDRSESEKLLNRKNSIGYYMHEMVALYAACNGWNWTKAAESMDWAKVNDYMVRAKAQGKKVIWSEPAQGWSALSNNPSFKYYAPQWKQVLVPMFATNFRTPAFNHVPAARAGAQTVAKQYGLPVGESVQSWYFREGTNDLTTAATVNLANYGLEIGSTYYQIEGTYGDMVWGTDYMKGILAFSKQLEKLPSKTPSPQKPSNPTPPIVKVPLYQLWNVNIRDHLYVTDKSQHDQAVSKSGYVSQGVIGYMYKSPVSGTVPLYKYWSSSQTDHFYTTKKGTYSDYEPQGTIGYLFPTKSPGTTALYQLYSTTHNPDHYYTTNLADRNRLLGLPSGKKPWPYYNDQGITGYVFTRP